MGLKKHVNNINYNKHLLTIIFLLFEIKKIIL